MEITKYTIRASALQPIGNGCPTNGISGFIYQTFGAEKGTVIIHSATTKILKSADMQGMKAGNEEDSEYRGTTYIRASYSGRGLRTTDGDIVFSGQEEKIPEFIDESQVPGWG